MEAADSAEENTVFCSGRSIERLKNRPCSRTRSVFSTKDFEKGREPAASDDLVRENLPRAAGHPAITCLSLS
jgi:hypothetical protein